MTKRIIITEEKANELFDFEHVKLPKDIKKSLRDNKTSLGINPAFPPEDENRFDVKIILNRFKHVLEEYQNTDDSNNLSPDYLANQLSLKLKLCKDIEKPIRNNLEIVCNNVIDKLFGIPDDTVIFKCSLVDDIQQDINKIRLTPENTDDMEFDGIEQIEGLTDEVYKRRLINSLILGGAVYYTNETDLFISEIYKLNPKLPELYHEILVLNNLLLFLKEDKKTDDNRKQGGSVTVDLGNTSKKTIIEAEGIIFPFLLTESIKGFMELFVSHGLPKSRKEALYVMKKADFVMAEAWDMRFGPALWKYIIDAMGTSNSKLIPNVLYNIVSLPVTSFNKFMKEIFAKTKRGKEKMHELVELVENKLQMDDFDFKLNQKRSEYAPITNEYFTEEDLD
jgi:hypothetical protein